MKTLLKFILLLFTFSVLLILPNILIPLNVKMDTQSEYNALMLFVLLLTDVVVLIYLIQRLNLRGMKLFLGVLITFWGIQTFMTQVETWYFREAIPAVTNVELRNLFLRPLITAAIFIPIAIWILGKWKNNSISPFSQTNLSGKEMAWLSVAYVIIYFVFGYFVAWQFEAVRIFYSATAENLGFMGQLKQTLETKYFIIPFQLLRGLLWIIMGLPLIIYLKGSRTEKILACVLLYSFLPAIQLVVDNPFMPQPVRLAHFLEVVTSNGLFGLMIGYVSTRRVY